MQRLALEICIYICIVYAQNKRNINRLIKYQRTFIIILPELHKCPGEAHKNNNIYNTYSSQFSRIVMFVCLFVCLFFYVGLLVERSVWMVSRNFLKRFGELHFHASYRSTC